MNNIRARTRQVTLAAYSLIAVAVLAAVLAMLPAAPAMAQTPAVTITVAPTSLSEDAGATDITVTATLSGMRSTPTTVTLSLAGTANQGRDYSVVGTLPTITVPAQQTERSANVIVAPTNDTFWEGDETIVVDGSATGGLAVAGATLTLSDNETRPSIILYFDPLTPASYFAILEDSGTPTSFTLHAELVGGSTLEADTAITLSVDASSTAVLDTDYTGTLPAMEIGAGSTTGAATATFTPIDNSDRNMSRDIRIAGAAVDHLGNAFAVRSTPPKVSIVDDELPRVDVFQRALPLAAPVDLAFSPNDGWLSVSWEDVEADPPVSSYEFRYRELNTVTWTELSISVPATPTDDDGRTLTTLTGLSNYTVYEIEVAAKNSEGVGPYARTEAIPGPVYVAWANRVADGWAVQVRFSLTLDQNVTPATSRFLVTIGQRMQVAPERVVFTPGVPESITLIMDSRIPQDTNTTLSYTDPTGDDSSGVVQAINGGDALGFTGLKVDSLTYQLTTNFHLDDDFGLRSDTIYTRGPDDYRASGQSFTTGEDPSGYLLNRVKAHLVDCEQDSGSSYGGAIHPANADGTPGAVLHTLDPVTYDTSRVFEFDAPGGAILEPQTTYVMVISQLSGDDDCAFWKWGATSEAGFSDWSIADQRLVIGPPIILGTSFADGVHGIEVSGEVAVRALTPGTPTNVMLTGGDRQLVVSWTGPTSLPNPTSYDLRYRLSNATDWTEKVRDADSSLTDTLTELHNDRSFEVQVRAVSGDYSGEWSVAATGSTTGTASTDAELDTLSLSDVTLSPEFASTTLSYAGAAGYLTSYTTVTTSTDSIYETVEFFLGSATTPLADADPNQEDQQVVLNTGANTLNIKVTAEDGVTTNTYEIVVTRAGAPNVTVSSTALQILEGMNRMYSVVLTSQPTGDVTVRMDTDLANTDLSTTPSPTELTFTTLNWNQPQIVTVSAAVDADAVDDPAVTLEHSVSGGDYGGVTVSSVTVTIIEQTVPTLSVTGGSAQESASVDFVVTLSAQSSKAVTVGYATADGTAMSPGDYAAASSSLTFAPGETSKTVTVATNNDIFHEPTETFTLGLTNPTNAETQSGTGTATGTITDDDTAPTAVTLSLNPAAVGESAAATAVTVTASLNGSPLPTATTVTVSRTGGTATSGTDYPAVTDFVITIPAEQTSGTATLSFDPTGDSLAEGDETVILTGSVSGLTSGAATLTITDDDTAPTAVTLSLNPAAVGESAAATAVTVTASLNNSPLPTATTVTVSRTGGTATSGTDYTAINAFTVTIPAEQTSGTATLSFDPSGDSLAEGNETVILTGSATGLTGDTATLTITDDDTAPTAITLSLNPAAVGESAAATTVTVTASLNNSPLPTATTVTVSRTGGTATPGTDYPPVSAFTVTIQDGQTSGTATLSFDPSGDSLAEGNETVILTGSATGLTADTATLTITDDDPAPTAVTLSLNPAAVGESAAATTVTVTASLNNSPLPTATTVTVSRTGGTATSGTDYPAVTDFVITIPAEQTSGTATLSFDPTGDGLYEGNETVILTGSATGLTGDTATLTITDDDTAPTAVTLSLNPAAVGESATATTVTVTASLNNSPLPTATTVTVSRTGGTATSGTDYTAINAFTVTIQDGQTSGTATLSFDPTGDGLYEGNETVILTGSATGLTGDTATLTITDDDTAPTAITLSLNPAAVGESAAATTVTVTASLNNSPLPTATTVTVSRTGGTATSGTDYPAVTDFVITIPAEQTSGTATLSFDPSGDSLAEGNETVILTGSATGLTGDTATLTITDDDTAPTAITLSLNPAAVGESAAATTVTVTASLNNSPLPTATTVTVSRTGGTATSGTDYTAINAFTVTIQDGQTSGTATLSFDPTGDGLYEGNETVILTGSATGLTADTATLTITDDDPAPTAVMLSLNPAAIGESAAATTVTVTASLNNSPLPTATTVTVSRTGGTATSGTDYPAVTDFVITIPAEQTSGTATLSFDPSGDSLAEGNETVILTGSATGLTGDTATLTITDDDTAPTAVTLSLNPAAVGESAAATAVTVTASLNNSPLPTATTVTVSRTGGTATSGTDYPAVTDFVITIPAEQTSGTATLSFDPSGDSLAEGNETVILTGSATGLTGDTATLTITDDDTAPTAITLSLNPAAVGESAAATTVTVTASLNNSPLPTATTVTVSRTGGTATSGTDYPAVTDFVITIPAEQTSGTATLSFDPTGDGLYEGNETVILTGSATGLTADTATLTITDDDTAPTAITLSLNPAAVGESAAATTVTVTASLNNSPLPTATTVTVSRTGGTATSATDYPAISDFTVTILAGQTSGTAQLSFDPSGDNLAEGDETVILTGGVSGLTSGTATLTITDDDAAPTAVMLSLNPAAIGESAAATAVTVTASLNGSPLPTSTTVTVSRTGGTATSGTDYPAINAFTVTIPSGQTSGTATLSFDPSGDGLAEGDETVILTGTVAGLTSGMATLTIIDDDPPPTAVTLSLNPAAVGESAASTAVTVTASLNNSPLPTATTVTVSRTEGTATSATDYPAISDFTVTIPSGQTTGTATLSFDPSGDGLAEGDETVILTGSAAGLDAGAATLTITDDDLAPTAITLSLNPAAVGESATATTVTVTASLNNSPLPTATTVTVSRTGGTATSATDYPAISDFTVTILAGQTSGTATLSFDPSGDSLAEGNETVILTGSATGLTAGTATLTITDDDAAPTAITLSLNPVAVGESAAATAVTVTASLNNSPLPTATTVTVSRTGGTATSGTDYPAVSDFTVTILAGQTSGTAQLSFDPSGDNLAEGGETVILTGSVSGLTSGAATLTITDDDAAPTAVMLSLNPTAVGESATATGVTVTASLNGSPLPTATTVTVSRTGGTATPGTDYPPVSAFTVTIQDGQTSGTATLSFDPSGDSLAEGNETVILTGSATGLNAGTATLTITDDDTAPTAVTLSLNPTAVGESAAATAVTVTASLNNSPLPTATTVTVSRTGGTATSGTDYPAVTDFVITIPSGQTSGTAQLSFDPTGDSLAEGDETVILTGSVSGLTSGAATLTITDDDTAPTAVTLSLNPAAVGESAAATAVTVTASLNNSPLPTATTVTVSRTGGTATSGTDYTAINAFTVTIPSGQTSGTAQLSFDPSGDSLAEGNETVILTGSATGLTAGTATLTITDDDTAPTAVTLSLNPAAVGESATATMVTVTASLNGSPLPTATTVTVSVTGGTAVSGTDYAAVSDFTVTIQDGQTSGTTQLSFNPTDDGLYEGDETVILTGSATGLTADTATLTITDNNTLVTFGASFYTVSEGAAATVLVDLSTVPTAPVTILLTKEHLGGATGTDYSGVPPSVTFTTEQTQRTFTVTATDDSVDDEGESLLLGFGPLPDGFAPGSPATARVTLMDNDMPPPEPGQNRCPNDSGERMVLVGNGDISQAGESDFWRVEMDPGRFYVIEVLGTYDQWDVMDESNPGNLTLSDPHLFAVWSGDGSEQIRNTGMPNRRRVLVERADDLSGFHQLEVRSFQGNTGTYQIKMRVNNICVMSGGNAVYSYDGGPEGYVWDTPSNGSTRDKLRPHPLQNIQTQSMLGDNEDWYWDQVPDEDWFAIEGLKEDHEYTIDVWTMEKELPLKHQATRLKILGIYDSNGMEAPGTSSADSGKKVRVTFQPQNAGTFYVSVGSEAPDRTGAYRISISAVALQVSNATEADTLTAALEDIPANHDGSSAFTFRIAFSEEVNISWRSMRDHALAVTGGTVTDARRVDGRKDLWELTVEPAGTGPVSILVPQDRACTETGALCTADGRMLSMGLGQLVPGPAPTTEAAQAVPNNPATGQPVITGTPQVGGTLIVDTSGISDQDGLQNAAFTYRWIAAGSDIEGATGSSHTIAEAQEGRAIRVSVSFTDDGGNEETLTSAATASVAARPDQGSTPDTPDRPVGTAVFVGGVDLEWNDVPGADSYDVQLFRNGQWMDLPGDGVEIASYGAGAIISELDPGSSYWFQVRARNAHGSSDWSDFRAVVSTNQSTLGRQSRPDNVTASGAPVINGTAQVGESLTADAAGIEDGNGLNRVEFRFQWVSNDGSADAEITGSTDSTYTLVAADEGKTVKVRVSFTDRGGYAESLTSAATDTVSFAVQQQVANSPATGAPGLSGTAQVGETLTADTSGIADADGQANATFTYQWVANDRTSDTDIAGATGSSYTLVTGDQGKTIRVRVSFTDDAGHGETLTGAATAAVAAAPNSPATGAPSINGTAQVGETLTAATSGIADADGQANATFTYQWVTNDGTSDTDIAGATGSSYTLVTGDQGKTIRVRVSFTDDAGNDETLTSAATAAVDAASNSPATGTPTITGTAQVGQTLSADTSGIADADGQANATFTYQWVTNDGTSDTDIAGATGSSYTLVTGDQGKTIRVRVSFTDDAGHGETLTGAATAAVAAAPNSPATGAPSINGTAQVGETLSADTSAIADADGLTNVSYSYQWIRNDGSSDSDITGATDSTYALVDADEGKTIKVKVGFTDDAGSDESLASAATGSVAAHPDQGSAPGTPDRPVGTAVFVGGVDLEWNDVPGADSYDVQLFRNGQWMDLPGDGVEIASYGAGAIISELDPGSSYWFQVRARNAHGSSDWSDFRAVVSTNQSTLGRQSRPDNVTASGAPVINGTAQVGESLTADAAGIEDGNGLNRVEFRFQWVSNDGSADAEITGSTDSTYTLVAADEGKTVKVRVSFTDRGGYAESLTSAATDTVSFAVQQQVANSPATGAPGLSGTAQVGETLTADTSGIADTDGLSNVTYSYQWVANDGTSDTDIAGATGSSYTLAADDEGRTIKVKVSFTDDADNGETLTSAATAAVDAEPNSPATGAPTITGTAQVGQALTADTSGIADADGLSNVSFSYQWIRNDGSSDSDITSATGSSYTLAADDEGRTIKVKVSFTDDADNGETLTSAATAAVDAAPNSPATGAPAISGTAQVGQTLTADTSGIADADGLDNVSYGYQWIRNDGGTDTDISGATDSGYTLAVDDEGRTIKVKVSFTDDADNGETLTSAATAAVAAAPNSPATGTPTITGTAQVGQTLSADTSGIADADGQANATFTYQWVTNDGTSDTDIAGATGSSYTLVTGDQGKTIRVRVSFTDDAGHGETLTSAATGIVAAALLPLTVSLENNPATHNGTDVFTFEIRFSEEFPLSFRTLKVHALQVTGGTVKKARRMDNSSDIHWRITVRPDADGNVTIVLPVPDDCDDQGAICTRDGRKLSNRLEFTVVGPGG